MTTPARPEIPMVYYYDNRRIEELSRDELIHAFRRCVDERDAIIRARRSEREIWKSIMSSKYGR